MTPASYSEAAPYARAWTHYRRASIVFWLLFVTLLPGMHFVFIALGRPNSNVTFGLGFIWMIAFAIAGYQKGNFDCPRCGETLFAKLDNRPWH